ncbi:helix-turn-helix domain-containing protein [Chryseobacterium pennipullorum]|uniref:Helix-turn-helix domain-containing protein n=2 Tax=Chryseobacterium pennipullorum TaxID=2258963 RepID=A0A3D9AT24_9FLAO|nr:helix-turn-helix domain-containing protein [Chryseobacterium pennipullorum]
MKRYSNSDPDYEAIYKDILYQKFPEKLKECLPLLKRGNLSAIDILNINRKIFGQIEEESVKMNQKFRSYNRSDILQILDYQKKNKLNNTQLANHYKLSKNTITKWKKIFM